MHHALNYGFAGMSAQVKIRLCPTVDHDVFGDKDAKRLELVHIMNKFE
jgi:hypothetical protein